MPNKRPSRRPGHVWPGNPDDPDKPPRWDAECVECGAQRESGAAKLPCPGSRFTEKQYQALHEELDFVRSIVWRDDDPDVLIDQLRQLLDRPKALGTSCTRTGQENEAAASGCRIPEGVD